MPQLMTVVARAVGVIRSVVDKTATVATITSAPADTYASVITSVATVATVAQTLRRDVLENSESTVTAANANTVVRMTRTAICFFISNFP